MDELIKAFQIFRKYTDATWPTQCEHDVMLVYVDPKKVSKADIAELNELNFNPDEDGSFGGECFFSFYYGSA